MLRVIGVVSATRLGRPAPTRRRRNPAPKATGKAGTGHQRQRQAGNGT